MFFPGRKLVKSKYNCSMNSLLHLFRVCHFHGPLINKWVHRNIHVTLMARGHFTEDLKWLVTEKSCEVFPWVKQWACWLHEVTLVCFATLGLKWTAVLNHNSRRNKAGQMLHPWLRDHTAWGTLGKAPTTLSKLHTHISALSDSHSPLSAAVYFS